MFKTTRLQFSVPQVSNDEFIKSLFFLQFFFFFLLWHILAHQIFNKVCLYKIYIRKQYDYGMNKVEFGLQDKKETKVGRNIEIENNNRFFLV